MARALSSEMHAGFTALRQHCPCNYRRPVRKIPLTEAVEADVARIVHAWALARDKHGRAGPFLFGRFSAADAMFAPVVNRFHTYDIPVDKGAREYMDAIMALPAWKAWVADAEAEPWRMRTTRNRGRWAPQAAQNRGYATSRAGASSPTVLSAISGPTRTITRWRELAGIFRRARGGVLCR